MKAGPVTLTLLAALAVTAIVAVELAFKIDARHSLGDTDDAMRLVMVRDLVGGRGWYDQLITRLAPPQGTYMHWSRLVDAGEASLLVGLRQLFEPVTAEWLMRVIWPLGWILPLVVSALAMARALGARLALLLTTVLAAFDLQLYRQFIPGRIDHHNLQIVMAMTSLACAVAGRGRARAAIGAACASALGLAIGLEALPVHALIGVFYALGVAREGVGRRAAGAYGLALCGAAGGLFLVQTPPWRWGVATCDAMGANLTVGLCIAGLAVFAAAAVRRPMAPLSRLLIAGLGGALAAGVCLALDPACVHGAYGGVDADLRRLWLDKVQEAQPLWVIWRTARPSAIAATAVLVTSAIAVLALLASDARREPGVAL
ncbi:MAG TPA: hypothetical protein VG248_01980, partial [Caulobacteraceae bacterium]|nr:hypothetical protein [Caulobacteraceae bacterium]